MSSPAPDVSAPAKLKTLRQKCAIFFGGRDGKIIGGGDFGLPFAMSATLFRLGMPGVSPWIGLELSFPMNPDNEDIGIGCVHTLFSIATAEPSEKKIANQFSGGDNAGDHAIPKPAQDYRIAIKFPRGLYSVSVEDASPELRARFAAAPKRVCLIEIRLEGTARVNVERFGIPFTDPDHPSAKTVLRNEPMVDNITLLDIIEQRQFLLAINERPVAAQMITDDSRLPPALSFPWGQIHSWDYEAYRKLYLENKGAAFRRCWTFENDNMHVSVLSQVHAQDVVWAEEAAREIRENQMRGYFVPLEADAGKFTSRYFVVIAAPKDFVTRLQLAWKRLLSSDVFAINLLASPDDGQPAIWDAKMVEHPKTVKVLCQHPVASHEVVLLVRRPKEKARGPDFDFATFSDRSTANAALEQSPAS